MNYKILGIFICILFIIPLLPVGANATKTYDPLDGGWIEEIDGVMVLHVSGTNYEMGYQHGYLLKDKIEQTYRTVFALDETGEYYGYILNVWYTVVKQHTPDWYIEEMQGLADGSGKPLEDVIVFVLGWNEFIPPECMEMAGWGSATSDGKLRHFYSLDISLQAKDPDTGIYLQENQILMVRKPTGGCSSLQPFFAGSFAGLAGINDQEIAISCESSQSSEWTWNATFIYFRIRNVLDNTSSLEDALGIMTASRNGYMNYVVSDGKIPMSYVGEETVNYSYVGTWDNKTESKAPFWSIENVVRRKNMYINPITAKTQRSLYDPRIYLFLGLWMGDPWFNTWSYYKTLSQELEDQWGNLNCSNILALTRSIYRGETNWFLKLSALLGLEHFSSFSQWVACPETGDMLISFADRTNQSQYNKIHQFNLFDLLESQPP